MKQVVIAKALADETRFRLLMALNNGELCVCQLVALVNLANATVSKHLLVLRGAGLVESRKEGRWMYYRISRAPSVMARDALKWARQGWKETPVGRSDRKFLRQICCQTPEELCRVGRLKKSIGR